MTEIRGVFTPEEIAAEQAEKRDEAKSRVRMLARRLERVAEHLNTTDQAPAALVVRNVAVDLDELLWLLD